MISERTRNALQAAKARGKVSAMPKQAAANRAAAMGRASELKPLLRELLAAGMSARQIAAELTTRGVPTPRGGAWHSQTVIRMIDRVVDKGDDRWIETTVWASAVIGDSK